MQRQHLKNCCAPHITLYICTKMTHWPQFNGLIAWLEKAANNSQQWKQKLIPTHQKHGHCHQRHLTRPRSKRHQNGAHSQNVCITSHKIKSKKQNTNTHTHTHKTTWVARSGNASGQGNDMCSKNIFVKCLHQRNCALNQRQQCTVNDIKLSRAYRERKCKKQWHQLRNGERPWNNASGIRCLHAVTTWFPMLRRNWQIKTAYGYAAACPPMGVSMALHSSGKTHIFLVPRSPSAASNRKSFVFQYSSSLLSHYWKSTVRHVLVVLLSFSGY